MQQLFPQSESEKINRYESLLQDEIKRQRENKLSLQYGFIEGRQNIKKVIVQLNKNDMIKRCSYLLINDNYDEIVFQINCDGLVFLAYVVSKFKSKKKITIELQYQGEINQISEYLNEIKSQQTELPYFNLQIIQVVSNLKCLENICHSLQQFQNMQSLTIVFKNLISEQENISNMILNFSSLNLQKLKLGFQNYIDAEQLISLKKTISSNTLLKKLSLILNIRKLMQIDFIQFLDTISQAVNLKALSLRVINLQEDNLQSSQMQEFPFILSQIKNLKLNLVVKKCQFVEVIGQKIISKSCNIEKMNLNLMKWNSSLPQDLCLSIEKCQLLNILNLTLDPSNISYSTISSFSVSLSNLKNLKDLSLEINCISNESVLNFVQIFNKCKQINKLEIKFLEKQTLTIDQIETILNGIGNCSLLQILNLEFTYYKQKSFDDLGCYHKGEQLLLFLDKRFFLAFSKLKYLTSFKIDFSKFNFQYQEWKDPQRPRCGTGINYSKQKYIEQFKKKVLSKSIKLKRLVSRQIYV